MQEQFVAVKAIITHKDKILLLRERAYDEATNVGKWDVPGGRLGLGESPFDGIKREVAEETGLHIRVDIPISIDAWEPTIQGLKRHIVGMYIWCTTEEQEVRLSHEHDEYRWVTIAETGNLPLMSTVQRALTAFDALQKRLLK